MPGMIDLGEVFLAAWARVKPYLDSHPDELRMRLGRRGARGLTRPLREWCIAVRANDLRITAGRAAIVPERAPERREAHEVTLDRRLLLALHHPVEADFPHSTIPEMAERMGVTEYAVRRLVKRGDLRQRRIKGFGHRNDRWGGRPFVSGDGAFDPNFGARMRRPDAVWGGWWQDLARDVPEGFVVGGAGGVEPGGERDQRGLVVRGRGDAAGVVEAGAADGVSVAAGAAAGGAGAAGGGGAAGAGVDGSGDCGGSGDQAADGAESGGEGAEVLGGEVAGEVGGGVEGEGGGSEGAGGVRTRIRSNGPRPPPRVCVLRSRPHGSNLRCTSQCAETPQAEAADGAQ